MRFLVCSSKGGVGKSFVARHFLPLIYSPIGYIDTDLSNRGAKMIENSAKVITAFRGKVEELLSDPYPLMAQKHLVLDVGGKDEEVIRTIETLSELLFTEVLDWVVIPTTGAQEETRNALETAFLVRKKGYKGKIAIALNRYGEKPFEEQFESYLKAKEGFKKVGAGEVIVPLSTEAIAEAERKRVSVADLEVDEGKIREKIALLWQESLSAEAERKRLIAEEIKSLQRQRRLANDLKRLSEYARRAKKVFEGEADG